MKLNLGCGKNHLQGYINCDEQEENNPDLILNLNVYPYHFHSNTADYILLKHVLEHLDNPVKTIEECHRILKKGGVLEIRVPHWNADLWGNPWHKHRFSKKWFMCFDKNTQEYKGTVGGLWPVPDFRVKTKLIFEIKKMRYNEIIAVMVKK